MDMVKTVTSAVVAAFIGVSGGTANAASVNVDFSFRTVSGTLTFDGGIGDSTAEAISFFSSNFGEDSSLFIPDPTSNYFEWIGSEISFVDFGAEALTASLLMYARLSSDGSGSYLSCVDLLSPFDACAGREFDQIRGSSLAFSTVTTPVPVPAGLPLVLTGLAGFAGLRIRNKRKERA